MQTLEPVSTAPQPDSVSARDAELTTFAAQFHLTLDEYKRLVSSMTYDEVITCLELVKASKHRSGFRSRMSAQIRTWLPGSQYLKPLTHNQFRAMTPKWPIHYTLP